MRVVIFTAGTQGDARPNVALGQGLQRRGHDVTVVTSRDFKALVLGAGLRFAPLTADFQAMMRDDRDRFDSQSQIIVARHGLRRLRDMAAHWAAEGLPVARGAGLIIGSGLALYLAASIAEALDVPFVRTMLQPIEPAREITPMLLGTVRSPLPGWANLAMHGATRHLTWQLGRRAIARVRRDLGLAPYPTRGPWRSRRAGQAPLLNGFSPKLVPPSEDWGPHVATTGAWILEEMPAGSESVERLASFLRTGPPPVYVGFGSMVARDAAGLATVVRDGLRLSGRRAIVAGGWGGLDLGDDDNILVVDAVPHGWLLPQVVAAVHHCGAGTTHAVARAGIPSVPVPFLLDQFFWAGRLHRLGVATRPLRRLRMNGADLANAIEAADEVRSEAAVLGEELRNEDGVQEAFRALERWGLLPAIGAPPQTPPEVGPLDRQYS